MVLKKTCVIVFVSTRIKIYDLYFCFQLQTLKVLLYVTNYNNTQEGSHTWKSDVANNMKYVAFKLLN